MLFTASGPRLTSVLGANLSHDTSLPSIIGKQKRMQTRNETNLWEHTLPIALESHRLQTEIDVDVAIIGGGFTGVSAALRLVERGASVALVEALRIGAGGSGKNVGLVNSCSG